MTCRKITLIEYFITADTALIFGVRADWEVPRLITKPINQTDLRIFVENNFGTHNRVRGLKHILQNWHYYDFLVAPVAEWAAPEDIVYLVPHGWLHYLPLHALKVEGQYLIERNPVIYSPSASVIRYCQAKRKERQRNSAGALERQTAAVFGDSRNDLKAARDEAQEVAGDFGVPALLGDSVTAEAFRQSIVGVDIVHFAGHGEFNAGQPLESGLKLAREGKLTAREVFNLSGLEASLVTLSGCETGVSENHPGDELIGLARAFLYAGTPTLLVSLWRVADNSTSFLMKTFYDTWWQAPAITKIDALRQAILQTKSQADWGSLYHWAPFILIGDWK